MILNLFIDPDKVIYAKLGVTNKTIYATQIYVRYPQIYANEDSLYLNLTTKKGFLKWNY